MTHSEFTLAFLLSQLALIGLGWLVLAIHSPRRRPSLRSDRRRQGERWFQYLRRLRSQRRRLTWSERRQRAERR